MTTKTEVPRAMIFLVVCLLLALFLGVPVTWIVMKRVDHEQEQVGPTVDIIDRTDSAVHLVLIGIRIDENEETLVLCMYIETGNSVYYVEPTLPIKRGWNQHTYLPRSHRQYSAEKNQILDLIDNIEKNQIKINIEKNKILKDKRR